MQNNPNQLDFQHKFVSLFVSPILYHNSSMLSIERVKELLNDQNISDQKAREIRDDFRSLAEIIFEQWRVKNQGRSRSNAPLNKSPKNCYDGNIDLPKKDKPNY